MKANGERLVNLNKGDHGGGLKRVGSSQEIKGRYIKAEKMLIKKFQESMDRSSVLCQISHLWIMFPRVKSHPVGWRTLMQFTKPSVNRVHC
jgi:hypothetical protein